MQFVCDADSSAVKLTKMLKIGNLFKLSKKHASANNIYDKIIAEYPLDFRAYFNLAQLKTEICEFDEAVDLYKSVIVLSSEVIESYGAIAALYIKLNKPEMAEIYCIKGLSIVADDRACLHNLNVALRQTNNINAAISMSVRVIGEEKLNLYLYDAPLVSCAPSDPSVLTVVCVKWGTKYNATYVNNLYRAVNRHCPRHKTIRMVCFTDNPEGVDKAVDCLPFDPRLAGFRGWWLKIMVFSPLVASSLLRADWLLYIDLDTVICNSLDFVFDIVGDSPSGSSSCSSSSISSSSPASHRIYVLNASTMQNEGKYKHFFE
jgi:tetratricopeptide (TPR) repeat protein